MIVMILLYNIIIIILSYCLVLLFAAFVIVLASRALVGIVGSLSVCHPELLMCSIVAGNSLRLSVCSARPLASLEHVLSNLIDMADDQPQIFFPVARRQPCGVISFT